MATPSDRAIPPEDTFNLLRDKAAKESDEFTVKVFRRAFQGGVPELAATLSQARVEHFNSPELWIPALCGGGNYSLQGYHPTDLSKPVGGFLQFKMGDDPRPVDMAVIKRPDWRGPAILDYPRKEAPRERDGASIYDVAPNSPPAPGSGDSATRTPQAWSRSAGGGFVQEREYGSERGWQGHQAAALEAEKRRLENERLENEREKHRAELEGLKKSHEADMRALKLELMSEIRAKPADSGGSAIAELLKSQAEDRRAAEQRMTEDRRAAETRAAEDRREAAKEAAEFRRDAALRQEKADERFNAMMMKVFERPKEDPLAVIEKVTALLGKNNTGEAHMKMMANMAEMHSVQMGSAIDFIHAAADMQLGGAQKDESPIIKAVEAGMKGIGSLVRGARAAAVPPQQFAQPQIPPTFEQQARAPLPPPAQQHVPPAGPPPPAQPQQQVGTALEQIEGAIRQKYPIAQVAAVLITHFNDPSIQAALAEAGGDMEALIQKRLGNWSGENPENKAYLDALFAEVEQRLGAAGLFDEGGDGGADGGEGGGDQDGDEDPE